MEYDSINALSTIVYKDYPQLSITQHLIRLFVETNLLRSNIVVNKHIKWNEIAFSANWMISSAPD